MWLGPRSSHHVSDCPGKVLQAQGPRGVVLAGEPPGVTDGDQAVSTFMPQHSWMRAHHVVLVELASEP